MTATNIGVTVLIVLIAAALGTMTGAVCDNSRHHRWALIVALTVSGTVTIIGLIWWLSW